MGELVNKKDTEIKVLRKRINLHEDQHVQTAELQSNHEEKEKLYHQLVERNKVIANLQSENEKLHKENETLRNRQTCLDQTTKSRIEKAIFVDPT
jgi:peptidoglycan hydrolase CwlO-like protein